MRTITSAIGRLKNTRTLWLLGSQVGCEALTLLRSVFLARLLGPDEMGIVAILTLGLRLVEMLSDMASDRLLVQANDGDSSVFQATTQSMQVLRGVAAGLCMAALSVPLAWLMGLPELIASLAVMGLVPAVRGFLHLDYRRRQRDADFQPQFLVELGAAIVFTVVAVGTSVLTHSYVAVMTGGISQAVALVVISHWIAQRPYQLAWDKAIVQRLVHFGTPMIVNGVVLFAVFQGDRLLVSYFCSLADLGRYAQAFQLAFIPGLIIARVVTGVVLPQFSRLQDAPSQLARRYRHSLGIVLLIAMTYTSLFMLWGNDLIHGLYGEAFVMGPALIAWLAMAQGVRVLRSLPSVTAMAFADSKSPLFANLLRMVGVVGAAVAGALGWGLEGIVIAGFGGELCAYATSIVLLQRYYQIPAWPAWRDIAVFLASLWLVWLINVSLDSGWLSKSLCTVGVLGACAAGYWILRLTPGENDSPRNRNAI